MGRRVNSKQERGKKGSPRNDHPKGMSKNGGLQKHIGHKEKMGVGELQRITMGRFRRETWEDRWQLNQMIPDGGWEWKILLRSDWKT